MTNEEKDKLIELSDLNKEDNIKYISSEAQGIAITLDSDKLAPNICKLERAYICGRRNSEKHIEELEESLGKLQKNTFNMIDKKNNRIANLEKENVELKEKLNFSTQYYQGEKAKKQLIKAKELLKWFVWYFGEGGPNLVPYKHKVAEAEQFLNSEVEK